MAKSDPLKKHKKQLREMRCLVSNRYPVQLHHCKGGSMREKGVFAGCATKVSDWLIIPLHYDYHKGNFGIHVLGVQTWEKRFYKQTELIDRLINITGVNVWEKIKNETSKQKNTIGF